MIHSVASLHNLTGLDLRSFLGWEYFTFASNDIQYQQGAQFGFIGPWANEWISLICACWTAVSPNSANNMQSSDSAHTISPQTESCDYSHLERSLCTVFQGDLIDEAKYKRSPLGKYERQRRCRHGFGACPCLSSVLKTHLGLENLARQGFITLSEQVRSTSLEGFVAFPFTSTPPIALQCG
eukprot:2309495-Amphidinium_carterae.1